MIYTPIPRDQEQSEKFVVYGKPGCHFCRQAKKLLESKGLDYEYKEIGVQISLGEFYHEIGEEVRTVPQIMVDKRLIGDYNSLVRYLKT
jgi:glutaredoxin|tara:strand:- start:134 stop:400 length:267 start_codon:yes stop_codon:yes gene_type:complete